MSIIAFSWTREIFQGKVKLSLIARLQNIEEQLGVEADGNIKQRLSACEAESGLVQDEGATNISRVEVLERECLP